MTVVVVDGVTIALIAISPNSTPGLASIARQRSGAYSPKERKGNRSNAPRRCVAVAANIGLTCTGETNGILHLQVVVLEWPLGSHKRQRYIPVGRIGRTAYS
jgi:hypothetical protein